MRLFARLCPWDYKNLPGSRLFQRQDEKHVIDAIAKDIKSMQSGQVHDDPTKLNGT